MSKRITFVSYSKEKQRSNARPKLYSFVEKISDYVEMRIRGAIAKALAEFDKLLTSEKRASSPKNEDYLLNEISVFVNEDAFRYSETAFSGYENQCLRNRAYRKSGRGTESRRPESGCRIIRYDSLSEEFYSMGERSNKQRSKRAYSEKSYFGDSRLYSGKLCAESLPARNLSSERLFPSVHIPDKRKPLCRRTCQQRG